MTAAPRTRADRLRLLDRIVLAERAVHLLRSKEEALDRERDRLRGHLVRARADWRERATAASAALNRARVLGGAGEVAGLRGLPATATVTPHWQTSMGITYPGDVICTPGPAPTLTATAALQPAARAYRDALPAAAAVAAAAQAERRLEAELAQTRRRRRAVEERLLPDLRGLRHRLDLRLDDLDREEAQRVRTAAGRAGLTTRQEGRR